MRKHTALTNGLLIAALLAASGCTMLGKRESANTPPSSSPGTTTAKSSPVSEVPKPGEPSVGEASGSYTSKGETVELKHAYAARGERFGSESIIVLLTDKPIPAESVAEEIKDQTLLLSEKIRGLEYVFDTSNNSYWVRYHPSQYQQSGSNNLKEFKVDGDTVRGYDEDDGSFTEGKYKRAVKFVVAIAK